MAKQTLNLSIDSYKVLLVKQLVTNVSAYVEQCFDAIIAQSNYELPELKEIESELNELSKNKDEISDKMTELLTKKIAIEHEQNKLADEQSRKAERMADAIKASGVLADNLR